MSNRKVWIILILFMGLVILAAGCLTQPSEENLKGNDSINDSSTPVKTLTFAETTLPTRMLTTVSTLTPMVTYSIANPLALNESYRFTSGRNEIIARFVNYDLAGNYGIGSMMYAGDQPGQDIITNAPSGTRFLFIYFTFLNNGETPDFNMPGVQAFSLKQGDGSTIYPESSIHSSGTNIIVQVNGTRKNMNEYAGGFTKYGLPVGNYYDPLYYNWFIPFTVPGKFDPATSYVSVKFNNNSSAIWKFQ